MTFDGRRKRRRRFWAWLSIGFLAVLVGLYVWIGPTLLTAWRHGFFDSGPERTYTATQVGNLRAIRTALMSYEESEGHFPEAAGWMDAIEHRLGTADLGPGEAEKKLVDPSVGKAGAFGWALNDAVSGKYHDDIRDPATTPLVFSSSVLTRNAHGEPSKLLPAKPRAGGNLGISISGEILHGLKPGR
jgi:hypothetical protein